MEKFFQFFRFNIVGVLASLLNLLLLWVSIDLLHVNYIVSNVATYFIACIVSYFLNMRVTFGQKSGSRSTLAKYLIMRCVIIAIDSFLWYLAVDMLLWNMYASKLLILVFTTLISFGYTNHLFKGKANSGGD